MSMGRLLVLPKLGLTMTEGTVAEWSIAPGTRFAAGQTVFVVESDKAAVEIEAPADGILDAILVPAGETVAVGTEIGKWTLDGDVPAGDATDAAAQPVNAPPAPAVAHPASDAGVAQARTPPAAAATPTTGRIVATPLARRQARASGVRLADVRGTGPRGRVVAADVAAALRSGGRTPVPGQVTKATAGQRTMAARMTASKREIPHFYLGIDVDVDELLALRQSLQASTGRRTTVTHLLVAAVVEALRREPSMNRVWTDEGLLQLPTLDVGLAVDTPRGLMNPVAHDLGPKPFAGIVQAVDEVILRARTAALGTANVHAAAVTLSNAGMHDVHHIVPIIVPGQSAILGVGSVQTCFRPDAQGKPVLQRELRIVLSADHRVHTGVSALAFLRELKSVLQHPRVLLEPTG